MSSSTTCQHSADGYTTFCYAVLDVRDIIHENYVQYQTLMKAGTCTGGAVAETADRTLSHVYGWQPWTEAASGKEGEGCGPKANLLENTPGYGPKIRAMQNMQRSRRNSTT